MLGNTSPTPRLAQAQANVDFFKQRLLSVRAELQAERDNLPTSPEDIQDSITDIELDLDRLQRQINHTKNNGKRLKQEMDDWRQWYVAIAPINKTQAWETLNMELAWRRDAMHDCETMISKLETQKLSVMGTLEQRHRQFAAYFNHTPLEQEPRWQDAQADLKRAQARLNRLQGKLQVA